MPRLRSLLALACVVVTLATASVCTPTAAGAATASDAKTRELEARRRDIAKKKADAAGDIDVLRSSDQKLEQALGVLNTNVRNQEAAVASARQAADVALAQAAKLRADEARTTARLGQLRGDLREVAVDAYVHGPSNDISVALASKDLTEATQRQQMLKVVSNRQTDVADELRATEEDLGVQRAAAEAATERAAARKKAAESKLGSLTKSLASQQRVAADIEDRLEARLGEADALAELDSVVAGQIKARQAALARLVAARPPAQRASRGASRIVGATGGLATVRGITVAASVAPALAALLDAADADGFSFSGGGYRDPQAQVAVRRNNCGTSDYAIYEMPPSQCSPQTARPGTSMHEQGLAIDFSSGGSLITSRSSAAYRWLAANAGRFGFRNLPEEPWHWSTNGR
jgi:peptidoglycan hydrolase CwlO-like protein